MPRTRRNPKNVETLDSIAAARRFIAAAGTRVGNADEPELAALLSLQQCLDTAVRTAIEGQRAYGRSWAYIAAATGTSRQAAQQRWGTR